VYKYKSNNQNGGNFHKIAEQEFAMLTRQFDLEDWRTVRTEHYWKSDEIKDKTQRLLYKIKLIRYYNKHGKPEE
jgi:hypothetical protein